MDEKAFWKSLRLSSAIHLYSFLNYFSLTDFSVNQKSAKADFYLSIFKSILVIDYNKPKYYLLKNGDSDGIKSDFSQKENGAKNFKRNAIYDHWIPPQPGSPPEAVR